MRAPPDALTRRHFPQARELSAVEDVGQRLALVGRAQHVRRVVAIRSLSTQKRKKQRSAATVRTWLEGAGRRSASAAKKRRRLGLRTLLSAAISLLQQQAKAGTQFAVVGPARDV
jgi:hypothetical protein